MRDASQEIFVLKSKVQRNGELVGWLISSKVTHHRMSVCIWKFWSGRLRGHTSETTNTLYSWQKETNKGLVSGWRIEPSSNKVIRWACWTSHENQAALGHNGQLLLFNSLLKLHIDNPISVNIDEVGKTHCSMLSASTVMIFKRRRSLPDGIFFFFFWKSFNSINY